MGRVLSKPNRMDYRPNVVLPLPLSPTRASHSPFSICRLTSFPAWIVLGFQNSPPPSRYVFTRLSIAMNALRVVMFSIRGANSLRCDRSRRLALAECR